MGAEQGGCGGCVPRKMQRYRTIQTGLHGGLSKKFLDSVAGIEDVTELTRAVCDAHPALLEEKIGGSRSMGEVGSTVAQKPLEALAETRLPRERPYVPHCALAELKTIGICPQDSAEYADR